MEYVFKICGLNLFELEIYTKKLTRNLISFFSINAGVYGAPIANSHHISRSMSSHAGLAESMSSGGKTIFFCKLMFYCIIPHFFDSKRLILCIWDVFIRQILNF